MNNGIQWFPGHMAKTGRELKESVKLSDLVIEVMDARIPRSSGNPDFNKIFAGRRRIIVLNKEDLADPACSEKWRSYFNESGIESVFTNSRGGDGMSRIRRLLKREAESKAQKQADRGVIGRSVRAIVAGIPNSGKSTLINSLSGRAPAKTGDRPGVTRQRQWIRLEGGIEILDTPGILWPKFENAEIARHLAFTGAIRDEIYDITDIAEQLLGELCAVYPELVAGRYGDIEATNQHGRAGNPSPCPMLGNVALRRGFLLKGGVADLERAAAIVLDEFRAAKIGRITLENP